MGDHKSQILYASLIGINIYEGVTNLDGCIKDILHIDQILRRLSAQQPVELGYKPIYLLSPSEKDKQLIDIYRRNNQVALEYSPPNFENISRQALGHLSLAEGEDICVLYYSGHGSYTKDIPTLFECDQNETLVCMDSRSTHRDLMDKELAYLLHKTLKDKPNVHCLVITDCCHSGGSMRGRAGGESNKFRHESPSSDPIALQDYLGYEDGFYDAPDSLPYLRYVHLAACQENEKAMDTKDGGLFSLKLVELLKSGSSLHSYRYLMQSLHTNVSIANIHRQHPVAVSLKDKDLDRPFLGSDFIPYVPSYELRYIEKMEVWQLQAGSLLGIAPPSSGLKTRIRIEGTDVEADIVSVASHTSIAEGKGLGQLEKRRNQYRAFLVYLAIPRLVFGFEDAAQCPFGMKQKLEESFREPRHLYIRPSADKKDSPDLAVQIAHEDGMPLYALLKFPFLRKVHDPNALLDMMNAIGKWHYVKSIQCAHAAYRASDFSFVIRKTEGGIKTREKAISPGDEIRLSYKDSLEPQFGLDIAFAPGTYMPNCHVQALYMDSLYGIDNGLIGGLLQKKGNISLKFNDGENIKKTIPVHLDKHFGYHGIEEAREHLRVFVSAKSIDLVSFRQEALKPERMRSASMSSGSSVDIPKETWAVFEFPILLHRPIEQEN